MNLTQPLDKIALCWLWIVIKLKFAEQGSSVHQFNDLPKVTEDAVRAALRNEAKRHKYWKASAVTKMTINRIDNSSCLHVSLHCWYRYNL